MKFKTISELRKACKEAGTVKELFEITGGKPMKTLEEEIKHNNLTEFCQELERENHQLEVAIYDLKRENAKLLKHSERLNWLLSEETNKQIDQALEAAQ